LKPLGSNKRKHLSEVENVCCPEEGQTHTEEGQTHTEEGQTHTEEGQTQDISFSVLGEYDKKALKQMRIFNIAHV
jgi:hypothetical protein